MTAPRYYAPLIQADENTPRCPRCCYPIGASEFTGKGLWAECGCTAVDRLNALADVWEKPTESSERNRYAADIRTVIAAARKS